MPVPRLKTVYILLFTAIFLTACGLEDYPYIDPVYQADVENRELAFRAVVRLNRNSSDYFTHYAIFYRIYISDFSTDDPLNNLYFINPSLSSDNTSIRPYIDSSTLTTINMGTLFRGRGYKNLNLEGLNIDRVLSLSILPLPNPNSSCYLVFDFSSQSGPPTMYITLLNGTPSSGPYTLLRSNDGFTPIPGDRYFLTTDDLTDGSTINDNTNADVADKPNMSALDRYAYAAMYIVAVGFDGETSYSYFYSTPALIHVFRLPE